MDCAGSYSVAHRAGLLPTELTFIWGWMLLRSPHQGRGSPPAPAPTKPDADRVNRDECAEGLSFDPGLDPNPGPSLIVDLVSSEDTWWHFSHEFTKRKSKRAELCQVA